MSKMAQWKDTKLVLVRLQVQIPINVPLLSVLYNRYKNIIGSLSSKDFKDG